MTPPAEAERAVGVELYVSKGGPCHARAKLQPQDFVVEELIDRSEIVPVEAPGYYPVYRVQKRHIDTMHMAEELSAALKSRVSYGGLKDKRAEAIQYVTPTSLRSSRPEKVEGGKFTATLFGYSPRPLARGTVVGNRFEIMLRECCDRIGDAVEQVIRLGEARKLPNFYGLQRFGESGPGTHRIGRALVRRDFAEAVRLILLEPRNSDGDAVRAAREEMASERYEQASRLLPAGRDVERMVALELARHPKDWVRALRGAPLKLRRLYVQAYQSAIFNRTLSLALAEGEDISALKPGDNWARLSADGLTTLRVMGVRDPPAADAVPMVQVAGYAFRDYGSRFDARMEGVLKDEGVSPAQFYVEEMQEVSGEGGFRRPHMAVRDASWEAEADSLHLRFTLGRGQYATVLLREIIKAGDPAAAGLT